MLILITREYTIHANILLDQGCLEEAERNYREARRCNPLDSRAYTNLGVLLCDEGAGKKENWRTTEHSALIRLTASRDANLRIVTLPVQLNYVVKECTVPESTSRLICLRPNPHWISEKQGADLASDIVEFRAQ
jgi:hypothetical protein